MNKQMLGLKGMLLVVFVVAASSAAFVSAEPSEKIPSWVKTIAGLWANGILSDDEYLGIMQFLLDNQLLTIPQETITIDDSITQPAKIKPVIATNPFPKPILKYTPDIERFEEDGPYIKGLVTLKNRDGNYVAKDGKFILSVLNSECEEVYRDRKYVNKIVFNDYSLPTDDKRKSGFEWFMYQSKFKASATQSGTVSLVFQDFASGQSYSNKIPFFNLPFDYVSERAHKICQ